VRLVAGSDDEISDQVDAWQSTNERRDGGEHVLVAVDLQGSTIDRLRDVMGMQEVLSEETETYPDLESDHRDEQRALESTIREQLEDADVYVRTGVREDDTGTSSSKSSKSKSDPCSAGRALS